MARSTAVRQIPKAKTKTNANAKAKAGASPKKQPAAKAKAPKAAHAGEDELSLRLYVAGKTPKCITAFENLQRICDQYLTGKKRFKLEVVDLLENPQLARGDQILAVPTLVRKLPNPVRQIIGDLSNTEKVLVGLDVRGDLGMSL